MLAVQTSFTQKAAGRLHMFAHGHLGSVLCTELPATLPWGLGITIVTAGLSQDQKCTLPFIFQRCLCRIVFSTSSCLGWLRAAWGC